MKEATIRQSQLCKSISSDENSHTPSFIWAKSIYENGGWGRERVFLEGTDS